MASVRSSTVNFVKVWSNFVSLIPTIKLSAYSDPSTNPQVPFYIQNVSIAFELLGLQKETGLILAI